MICLPQCDVGNMRVRHIEYHLQKQLGLPLRQLRVLIINEEEIAVRGLSDTPPNQRAVQQILNELPLG